MDHAVEPHQYFQDPLGAVVALSAVWELLPSADHRVHLELHALGWQGSALWHRSRENRVAGLIATLGLVDERQVVCLCQLWVRSTELADATIDLMLRSFVQRVRGRLGQQAVLGAVAEASGGTSPESPVWRRGYSFRADYGSDWHHAAPVSPGPDSWHRNGPGYRPIAAPECLPANDTTGDGIPAQAQAPGSAGLTDVAGAALASAAGGQAAGPDAQHGCCGDDCSCHRLCASGT